MMTDFFLPCERLNTVFSSDGMGGLNTKYISAGTINGLVLPGSRSEHARGSDQTGVTHSSVFHTFASYGLGHNDAVRFRGKVYRLTSDPIVSPEQSVDTSWCSYLCEEVPE